MNAVEKITAARVQALSRWPYAASILFSFKLVEVKSGLDTMAVDKGLRLYFNPEFIENLDVQELATVLLHEVLHVVHNHAKRFELLRDQNPDARVFNIAGDLGINHILAECGMKFPESVPPVTFDDFEPSLGLDPQKPTEDAYRKLLPTNPEEEAGGDVPSQGGSTPAQGKPEDDPDGPDASPSEETDETDSSNEDGDQSDTEGDEDSGTASSEQGTGDASHPDCGSVSGGQVREYELADEDTDAPAASAEELDVIMDDFAVSAIAHGKMFGTLPGGLVRAIDDYLDPKIDWRRQLSALIRREVASIAGRKDYSYRRPSRRQDALRGSRSEIILPSMRQQPPPDIAVVYDTSASMTDVMIQAGVSEILSITQTLSGKATLFAIPCDTRTYEVFKIRTTSDVSKVRVIGRGGTNLTVGIDLAANLKPRPKVLVIITDGFTPWPTQKPKGVSLVLVLLTDKSASGHIPKWMEQIYLEI
jgi:predicted metal-dependent peptidase